MPAADQRTKLLERLDAAWSALTAACNGLTDAELTEPGVTDDWSVKDLLAHVTTWDGEALKHLPTILAGGRPPRYATIGGIDAFNARMAEAKRGLPLAEVRRQQADTHRRLLALIRETPAEQLGGATRFRRRLRLDTYGHYAIHTRAIRDWRNRRR